MSEYLLEILTEELPPTHQEAGKSQLKTLFLENLNAQRIDYNELMVLATERRLIVRVKGIASNQRPEEEIIMGPSRKVAYDDAGNPTQAALGFAKKLNRPLEETTFLETPKGEYLSFKKIHEGLPTEGVLQEILPRILGSLSFPKNMIWNDSGVSFSRPIRSILSLIDDHPLPFSFGGIKAGKVSRGNLILTSNSEILIGHAEVYDEALRESLVLIHEEERLDLIRKGFAEIESREQVKILSNQELLQELVRMVEYPVVFTGTFPEDFLSIPGEIIGSFLQREKRLFLTEREGRVCPRFVGIADASPEALPNIVTGFQRVVKATLQDALFFWRHDLTLDENTLVEDLNNTLYGENLGSYRDKSLRLMGLAENLADRFDSSLASTLKEAARLCKIDQLTDMVKEFPSLQGKAGGLLLKEKGYPEEVWKAVYEHYNPVNVEEDLPTSISGRILSLSDRLDSLCGAMATGQEFSGTKDPFGLRRLGNTIVKLLVEGSLPFSLEDLLEQTLLLHVPEETAKREEIAGKTREFLHQRFRFYAEEVRGLPYDAVNGVVKTGLDFLESDLKRIEALSLTKNLEAFQKLVLSYKRVKNILKNSTEEYSLDETLLQEKEEKELYQIFQVVSEEAEPSLSSGEFMKAQEALLMLRPFIDRFFDRILVMAEDVNLKNNRIALLRSLSSLFERVADYSEIVL